MKNFLIFGIIVLALIVTVVASLVIRPKKVEKQPIQTPTATPVAEMRLSSSAFGHNQIIPKKYTCDGENISPPLTIFEVPRNSASLVLIMDDPDAPAGTFVHWTVWNIDPKTSEIPEGTTPQEVKEGMTDFGRTGYGGPCPPSGTHRYFFKLYALDTKLELSESSRKKDIENATEGHILDQAELIGLYTRQR